MMNWSIWLSTGAYLSYFHVTYSLSLCVSKIQFYLYRLTCGFKDVFVFKSFYLNQMQQPGGIANSKIYVYNRNIQVTNKKLLIFPYHSPDHWSVFVVVNPNCIISAFKHTCNYNISFIFSTVSATLSFLANASLITSSMVPGATKSTLVIFWCISDPPRWLRASLCRSSCKL